MNPPALALVGQIVLDLDQLAAEIRVEHEACEAAMTATVQHAIRAGELLTDAKAQVRHGEWLPWLEANFAGARQTATLYMRLAANGTRVFHLDSVRDAIAEIAPPREMGVHYSSATDEWATPQSFFDGLASEFAFTTDVCALPSSAKCEHYYSPEDDGLAQEWQGTCWMNPPYGDAISAWTRKAHLSAQAGATVVALLPARVDTGWWWDYCRQHEIRFLRGRLKFGDNANSAPFPSALVVFGQPANVIWWTP